MKVKLSLSLLIVVTLFPLGLPVSASPHFNPDGPEGTLDLGITAAWSSDDEAGASSVAWGDWDGDGDLDLAVGSRVYENTGMGLSAVAVWSSSESNSSWSVAWGDWDGDGDLDLAVGNVGQSNRVYENTGGGLGTSAVWSSTESDATKSVAWGDWDGDGDLDLAVGNVGQPNRVYENGGGSLALAWSSLETDDTNSVAWGDWDGDGDLDLAAGNAGYLSQPERVYENTGTELGALAVWSSAERDQTYSVAWGDWDGDGDLDLAVGNHGPTRVYENTGAGLDASPVLTLGTDLAESVAWGDWDGDGDLDLAVGTWYEEPVLVYGNADTELTTWNPNSIRVYENTGAGLADDPVWSSSESDRTDSVAWGDWDGDGDLDLAAGIRFGPALVYENTGSMMEPDVVWLSFESDQTESMAWGDWDGDGDLDLAAGNDGRPNRVYENTDLGLDPTAFWSSSESNSSWSVAWGDWDGDGDLDLAVGNVGQSNRVYENTGGGLGTSAVWSSDETEYTSSVAWGDWDRDGDLDLAAGNIGQPNRVYENTDLGLATSAIWSSPESDDTYSVAWEDWDGDGDLDLAVGNVGQPNRVYENTGPELSTTAVWSSHESDDTYSVAWGDWDGDGDLDLAVGNVGQPNRVYENTDLGLGTTAAWSSYESDVTRSVAWGDWDGDGDLDLAAGNWRESNRVYENTGLGLNTAAAWSSDDEAGTSSIAWGDWDGDGDLDLAAGNAWLSIGFTWEPNEVYENNLVAAASLPNNPAYAVVTRPGGTALANFYSSAKIVKSARLLIEYHLYDAEGDAVPRIIPEYSTVGGGQWQTPTILYGRRQDLSASAEGTANFLVWDALADGARGDNVVFRITTVYEDPSHVTMPIQRSQMGTATMPFRLLPRPVQLKPAKQLRIGLGDEVKLHRLTLTNRTGRTARFGLLYNSTQGWPVQGPNLIGPLDDLASETFVVSVTIPFEASSGTLDRVDVTTGALFDPLGMNSSVELYTYKGTADVDLGAQGEAAVTAEPGDVMTYTLTVSNMGASPAGGIVVTDVLPAEVEFVQTGEEGVYSPTLGAVVWDGSVLLSGEGSTFTVTVGVGCVADGTVIAHDDYGVACEQDTTAVSGEVISTTVHYSAPEAAFEVGADEVGVGEVVAFSNSSQHATGYEWDFGDGSSAEHPTPMHAWWQPGTYSVTLTASNLCGSAEATRVIEVRAYVYLPLVMR